MPVESLRLVLGGWGSQWCGGIFTGEHGYLTALPFAQHWVLLWHVPALGGKNKDPTMNFISMFATIPTPQDVSQLIMSATRSYTRTYPISDCIKGFRPSALPTKWTHHHHIHFERKELFVFQSMGLAALETTAPLPMSRSSWANAWHCFSCFRTNLSFFILWWQE